MPDDSLWYLIIMGGSGLVLVFVGCFVVPLISFLCKLRYPPLSEEEQRRLNDANDQTLQSLLQLVDKQAVHVSDVMDRSNNTGTIRYNGQDPSNQNDLSTTFAAAPNHKSETGSASPSSSAAASSKKGSSVNKGFFCTTLISTAFGNTHDNNTRNSGNKIHGKMKETKQKRTRDNKSKSNKTTDESQPTLLSNDGGNGDEDYDVEAANEKEGTNTMKQQPVDVFSENDNDVEGDVGEKAAGASTTPLQSLDDQQHQPQRRDQDQNFLDSLDSQHDSNNNTIGTTCAICLEEYNDNHHHTEDEVEQQEQQIICASGGCSSHYFHKNCMKSLIRSRARKGIYEVVPCPICRLSFFAPTTWNLQVNNNNNNNNNNNATTTGTGTGTSTSISGENAGGNQQQSYNNNDDTMDDVGTTIRTNTIISNEEASPAGEASSTSSVPEPSSLSASASLSSSQSRPSQPSAPSLERHNNGTKSTSSENDTIVNSTRVSGPTAHDNGNDNTNATVTVTRSKKNKKKSKRKSKKPTQE